VDDRCDLLCLDLPRAERLRARQLDPIRAEVIAARMRALADPTRLVIVDALEQGGELCVCDLAWITGRAQNLVSHHLRSLKGEGLAESRREGKIVFYSLTEPGVRLYAQARRDAIRDPFEMVGEGR
jgi:ArsR family transcriptional regulator, lead/cadmium/zinc/bismuth-responsive transcriptional repressor